jgi:hypothetical protein
MNLTTFGKTSENLEAFEQSQAATTTDSATTATDTTTTTVDTSIAAPAADTSIVNNAPVDAAPVSDEVNSSSSFSIAIGDEPAQADAAPAQQPQPTTIDWKDAIKKADKTELYKELGLHDFAVEMNEHIAKGGKPADYLNAKAIDWNEVSDENVVKDNLRKQYSNFTPQEIERLFNRRYGVNDDMDADERDEKLLTLKADAYSARQTKISEAAKFKIADAITPAINDPEYNQWKQQHEENTQIAQQFQQYYLTHEATKSLTESKRVTISVGKDVPAFNFDVDRPELITQALTDGGKTWAKLTSTQSGEPDVQKQQLISLFMFNPQKFIEDVFNYGQQMGVRNKVVGDGQNAQRPQAKVIPVDTNQTPTYGVGKYGDKARN